MNLFLGPVIYEKRVRPRLKDASPPCRGIQRPVAVVHGWEDVGEEVVDWKVYLATARFVDTIVRASETYCVQQ